MAFACSCNIRVLNSNNLENLPSTFLQGMGNLERL